MQQMSVICGHCCPRDVRFGSKADMCSAKTHVRFASKSGRNSGHRMSVKGRSLLLCPVPSNVDLRRCGEGIAHINAENARCSRS